MKGERFKRIKRFFPIPYNSFIRENEKVKKQLDFMSEQFLNLNQMSIDTLATISELESIIRELTHISEKQSQWIDKTNSLMEDMNHHISKISDFQEESSFRQERQNVDITKLRNDMTSQIRQTGSSLERYMREYLMSSAYPHAIRQWYQNVTGKKIDLKNPRTFNEKIQWAKLYDTDPRRALLADKYLVRDWVKEKIGERYLIPLLGVYRKESDIDFDTLPDQFVLKANHGSGMNAIVHDKGKEDLNALRRKAASWLRTDYAYNYGFELHYRDIERRLIVEKYLEDMDGDMPDFKFWCFDGEVKFIEYIAGRKDGAHMALYDLEWNQLPFSTGAYPLFKDDIDKPTQLEEMIHIAEQLSSGFAHVRVDLYLYHEQIKFGEMTFTSSSGTSAWTPPEADFLVGEMYHLPSTCFGGDS